MENHFKIGDMVYFLESNTNVISVEVIHIAGGFCIIRFPDGKSGTKVRKSKIFQNEEEALLSRNSSKYYRVYWTNSKIIVLTVISLFLYSLTRLAMTKSVFLIWSI